MLNSKEFSEYNLLSETELKNIVSSENLAQYKGFGLSPNVRLFIFKQQPVVFSINLITQKLRDNCIAIVPPRQLHFLSLVNCSDYICIEVPQSVLIDQDFGFMTRLIYSTQKHLHLGKMAGYEYDQFKIFLSNENNHQLNLQLLKNRIEKAYPNQFGSTKTYCDAHFELANNFDSMINQIECFTLEHTVVRNYAEKLNCTERTLNRACEKVFRVSPQEILKHYLLLRSIHLLFNEQNLPHLIAEKLGYSTINAFMKFVKAQTSLSPNKIKKKFQEEGLIKTT